MEKREMTILKKEGEGMNKPLEYEKFSKDRRNLMLKGIDNLYDALDRKYLVLIADLRSEKSKWLFKCKEFIAATSKEMENIYKIQQELLYFKVEIAEHRLTKERYKNFIQFVSSLD
ncbi:MULTISPECIES: hypothetical protein [Bacillus cereus group]|nr:MULTISPECIES: hypothetical protein [Bacillus cereus group]